MAAELALASSGMMTPFPCAIFLAYNICAGLTGFVRASASNLPNPIAADSNLYVPINGLAIGDLMDMFNF
jgi:hypothetical protein